MIFHVNPLLTEDSHETCLIILKLYMIFHVNPLLAKDKTGIKLEV